jgi:hypothetical protein
MSFYKTNTVLIACYFQAFVEQKFAFVRSKSMDLIFIKYGFPRAQEILSFDTTQSFTFAKLETPDMHESER